MKRDKSGKIIETIAKVTWQSGFKAKQLLNMSSALSSTNVFVHCRVDFAGGPKYMIWKGQIKDNKLVLYINSTETFEKVEVSQYGETISQFKMLHYKAYDPDKDQISIEPIYSFQLKTDKPVRKLEYVKLHVENDNIVITDTIPPVTDMYHHPSAKYSVSTLSMKNLVEHVDRYVNSYNASLNPDFQRGHVWTEDQQRAYVEFHLLGGDSPPIIFNHPGWMNDFEGEMTLIDGLQRITAMRKFTNGELRIFKSNTAPDGLSITEVYMPQFKQKSIDVKVMSIESRKDVITYYIALNSAGTNHSEEEINRVKSLIK